MFVTYRFVLLVRVQFVSIGQSVSLDCHFLFWVCWFPHPRGFSPYIWNFLFCNRIKKKALLIKVTPYNMMESSLFLMSWFRRYRQLMSSFGTTTSKDFSTICSSHSLHKPVFISSFSFRGLKCSFTHCSISLKSGTCSLSTAFQNRVQIYKAFYYMQVLF